MRSRIKMILFFSLTTTNKEWSSKRVHKLYVWLFTFKPCKRNILKPSLIFAYRLVLSRPVPPLVFQPPAPLVFDFSILIICIQMFYWPQPGHTCSPWVATSALGHWEYRAFYLPGRRGDFILPMSDYFQRDWCWRRVVLCSDYYYHVRPHLCHGRRRFVRTKNIWTLSLSQTFPIALLPRNALTPSRRDLSTGGFWLQLSNCIDDF